MVKNLGIQKFIPMVADLKGIPLVFQKRCVFQLGLAFDRLVGKAFFQRRDDLDAEHEQSSLTDGVFDGVVDAGPQVEKPLRITGVVTEGEGCNASLQNFHSFFPSAEAFTKGQRPLILQRIVEHDLPQGGPGLTLGSGVDREGVPRGNPSVPVGAGKGVQILYVRLLPVVVVVSPMQKSADVELIKLGADDAVARRGHGHESIGYQITAAGAIVGPEVFYLVLNEGCNMVVRGNGSRENALCIEIVVGKRLRYRKILYLPLTRLLLYQNSVCRLLRRMQNY